MKDKVVFITGASSGYGKAMAEAFVREGAKVIIAARKAEPLNEVRNSLSGLFVEAGRKVIGT